MKLAWISIFLLALYTPMLSSLGIRLALDLTKAVVARAVPVFRGLEADPEVVDLCSGCPEDGALEDFKLSLKGIDQLNAHQVLVVEAESKRSKLIGKDVLLELSLHLFLHALPQIFLPFPAHEALEFEVSLDVEEEAVGRGLEARLMLHACSNSIV